jgi:hypothetical protein
MPLDESKRDWLESFPGYMELDDAERFVICNGCGAANSKFDFVPDTIYGLSIREACYRHDYGYHVGKDIQDKMAADDQFLRNMLFIINTQSTPLLKWPRRWRAMTYYSAVCDKGYKAFWAGKQ